MEEACELPGSLTRVLLSHSCRCVRWSPPAPHGLRWWMAVGQQHSQEVASSASDHLSPAGMESWCWLLGNCFAGQFLSSRRGPCWGFHAARTSPALWDIPSPGFAGAEWLQPFSRLLPHCDFVPFLCVLEALRAPVAVAAVVSGNSGLTGCRETAGEGRDLGCPSPSSLCPHVNQTKPPANQASLSCFLSSIQGDEKSLQDCSSLSNCSLETLPCLGVSSHSLWVEGGT